jgi:hypothetical protein
MESAAIGTPERNMFPMGFNAYVVPDGDHLSYPPFCSPVPAGPLNIVMDLFAPELREYPLEVRLIKVGGGEERAVLSVPAQEYESGNIALAVDLEPLVKYNILLIGNNEIGEPETLVTIPLEVRRAGDCVHTSKGTGWEFLVMVVALAGFVGGFIHRWNPTKLAG